MLNTVFPTHETPYFHVAHSSSSIFAFVDTGRCPEAVLFLSVTTEYLITLGCVPRGWCSLLSSITECYLNNSHECHRAQQLLGSSETVNRGLEDQRRSNRYTPTKGALFKYTDFRFLKQKLSYFEPWWHLGKSWRWVMRAPAQSLWYKTFPLVWWTLSSYTTKTS